MVCANSIYRYPVAGFGIKEVANAYRDHQDVLEEGVCPRGVNVLVLLKEKHNMAITFDQRGSTCLYYDHSSNTNGNYGTVRSCYINEQLDDVIEGIMKQGEWSHIVFVTEKKRSILERRRWLRFAKQTTLECDVPELYLIGTLLSIKTKDDFINVVLTCSLDKTRNIMKLVSEEGTRSTFQRLRLNWLFPTLMVDIASTVMPLVRDGDNIVLLTVTAVSYAPDAYLATSTAVIFLVHARRWHFIYSVFKPTVWLCIGCLPILLALPLYLVHKLRLDNTIHARRSEILATIIYETVGNVFRQGANLHRNNNSIRIMTSFYWFTIIVLVATYSGNLTSHLAVTKVKMPFTTLQGLTNDKRYTLLIEGNSSTELVLKNSKRGVYKEMWNKIQDHPERAFVESMDEAWDKLQNEDYIAFSAGKMGLTQYINDKICSDGVLLPEEYIHSGLGLIMQQGAPHKRRFDIM
ncbi:hypothetical protein LSH36_161g02020 [Paralvinella palmiformis]|uniref:Ionotropic glutamate receptor C-terminal domain-containing protein n=1 Tax=Paralvinella palmiformis TaxID=53620 RepID=A0AAD9N9D9_9ANNE|nr:hypothetical protein LSH36_161g02020 [Paralvinella palmiformis]